MLLVLVQVLVQVLVLLPLPRGEAEATESMSEWKGAGEVMTTTTTIKCEVERKVQSSQARASAMQSRADIRRDAVQTAGCTRYAYQRAVVIAVVVVPAEDGGKIIAMAVAQRKGRGCCQG